MNPRDNTHRARLYKLASLAFDRPDEEFREALLSGEFADQLVESAAALDNETLAVHADAVVEEAPTDEAGVDDLYSEWATHFGFEEGGEIQQYQIEYGPGTLVTSTDTIADIAGFFKAFGLEIRDGNRDRADHLCLQLEFCSHLALQTAYLQLDEDETGIDVLVNAQEDFIEDHLGRWIPRYSETVEDECVSAFYRELARLVDELVAEDVDRLDINPDVFPETPPAPMEQFTGDDDGDFRCDSCGIDSMPGTDGIPNGPPDRQ